MWKGKVDRGFAEHVLKSGSDWLADPPDTGVISISLQICSTWVCFHLVLFKSSNCCQLRHASSRMMQVFAISMEVDV